MATPALNFSRAAAWLLAGGIGLAVPLHAQDVPPPAYQLAAQRAGVPSTVLYAVAL